MSDIIKLVTAAEREAEADQEYKDNAHTEAVQMLESMLELVKSRKVASVAIAVAFEGGEYGHCLPTTGDKLGHLIGALADAQYNLLKRTNPT